MSNNNFSNGSVDNTYTHIVQITTGGGQTKTYHVNAVKLNSGFTVRCGTIAAKDAKQVDAFIQIAKKLAAANAFSIKDPRKDVRVFICK